MYRPVHGNFRLESFCEQFVKSVPKKYVCALKGVRGALSEAGRHAKRTAGGSKDHSGIEAGKV